MSLSRAPLAAPPLPSAAHSAPEYVVDTCEVRAEDGCRQVPGPENSPHAAPNEEADPRAGLYLGTPLKVPLREGVAALPEFTPEFVQDNSSGGDADAGKRWPWVTVVRGPLRDPMANAPDIDDLDIRGPITKGLPHFRLTSDRVDKLLKAPGT